VIHQHTREILATAFGHGRMHNFRLFQESGIRIAPDIPCLADKGYLGIEKLHAKSRIPTKKSRHCPLSKEQKKANRELARQRIYAEHVIGRLKVFRLRFNLIVAIYNLELHAQS